MQHSKCLNASSLNARVPHVFRRGGLVIVGIVILALCAVTANAQRQLRDQPQFSAYALVLKA